MRKRGGQIDHTGRLVDGGGLHGRDLVLTEGLAHDVEAAGERRITKAALPLPWPAGPDRGGQRLFGVDELGLGLGQRRGKRRDRFTGPGHGSPPSSRTSKLTAPDFERLARTPCPIASLASSGIKRLELALGPLMLEKGGAGAAENPGEFRPGIR